MTLLKSENGLLTIKPINKMTEKRKPLYKTNKLGTGQNKWIRLGVDPKYIVILNYKKIRIFPNIPKLSHYLGIPPYYVRRMFLKNHVRIINDVIFIKFSFSNIRFFTKHGAFSDYEVLAKITKPKQKRRRKKENKK